MLSKQGKARARPAGGSAPQRIPAGHDVSGSSLISYFGGPVISNVHVVAVDWTDTIDPTNVVDPVVSSTLPGFFATVTTSPYFSWLAEYSTTGLSSNPQTIGYGTFDTTGPGPGGTYIITPVINTTKTVDDSDIAAELNYQIEKGLLPAPQKDAKSGTCNSLYVVDFPPTIEITLGGTSFCTTFCGYHNSFHYAAAGVDIPYSVHPDLSSCSGCKVDPTDLESSESVHSHELVEATTDPNPESTAAWTSYPAGEVADVCASDADGVISGYDVQPIWSNANGACIVVAPLCDAITPAPPSCTPCTTTGAASCSGTIPLCEADITSANFGQCVGCLSETDCNGSTPFCDTSTKMCRACKAGDCTAPKGLCGALGFDLGQCVQCDSSSTTACTGATPACDTASFTCVACVVATDCPASTPFCDDTTLNCRKCTSTTDCPGGLCDSATGACVQCISSTDCGTETCNLSTHTCQCENSSQCANPAPVCGSSKSCGACQGSGDCAGNAAGSVCSGGSCVECVKSSDCPAGTPVCNPKTNQCRAAGGVDAGKDGAGPPVDSGKKKDGAADGGTITTSGGCSAAPSGASDGTGATPWLVMAGLAVLGRKRRRHA
jgi:MYXO-CTERM domain-containing protein